jgi:DNA primase
MNAFTIKAKLMHGNTSESYEEALQAKFDTSPYITRMKPKSADVQDFLSKWNINPDDVLYDIRQDRVVFPVFTRSGLQVDAVGRSVLGRQPKWLRYASSPVPYTWGKSRTAVIVEDAISAYAVSNLVADQATGLALLGTQLTDFHKWYIKHYFDKVIVALDPDASDKTMSITKELRSVVSDAKALRLTDDLKYMNEDDINQLKELL